MPLPPMPGLAEHGGDRRAEQVDDVNLKAKGGNDAGYLTRRISAASAPSIDDTSGTPCHVALCGGGKVCTWVLMFTAPLVP